MSTTVTLNGINYTIPASGDPASTAWGVNLTNYFVAIASGLLQKSGGAFTLTAETNFGPTFGLKSVYLKSVTANPATSGVVRFANNEGLAWRNAANSSNLLLAVNASDNLQYNGVNLITATNGVTGPGSATDNAVARFDLTTGKIIQNSVVTVDDTGIINSASLTASRALAADASKNITSSTTTLTELQYLTGIFSQPVCRAAITTFTASGTWTKATLNPKFVKVTVIGAGGGGGGTAATGVGESACAGSGGGGGTSIKIILAATLGATETVTVGAAGTAGAAGNNNGGAGGSSSFGTHATAQGGAGGSGSATFSGTTSRAGGAGGTASNGTINIDGGAGSNGAQVSGLMVPIGLSGGTSLTNGIGVPRDGVGTSPSASAYGVGGTGANAYASTAARAGGAGAAGIVIVEEFY